MFGGFSAEALANRIMDSFCKVLVTCDGVMRGAKAVPLKGNADAALAMCEDKGHKVSERIKTTLAKALACSISADFRRIQFTADLLRHNKLKFDKSRNDGCRVTYHDSCNLARSCGFYEEPRELLRMVCTDFQEMYPNRAENYCCPGGGGAMSMSEYTPKRLRSNA